MTYHEKRYARELLTLLGIIVATALLSLWLVSCASTQRATARPGYGEPNKAIGPSKDLYKSAPKWQP